MKRNTGARVAAAVSRRLQPGVAAILLLISVQLLAASCTPEHDVALQGAIRVSLAR